MNDSAESARLLKNSRTYILSQLFDSNGDVSVFLDGKLIAHYTREEWEDTPDEVS